MLKFKEKDSTHRPAKLENTRCHCRKQGSDCGYLCCHHGVQEAVVQEQVIGGGGNTSGDNWLYSQSSYTFWLCSHLLFKGKWPVFDDQYWLLMRKLHYSMKAEKSHYQISRNGRHYFCFTASKSVEAVTVWKQVAKLWNLKTS